VKKNKKDKDSLGPKTIMIIVGLTNKSFRAYVDDNIIIEEFE
jgi:hypothetical protein